MRLLLTFCCLIRLSGLQAAESQPSQPDPQEAAINALLQPPFKNWLRRKLLPADQAESMMIRFMETQLKPLPVLEGFVPEGWKDAIYGE